MSNLFIDTNTSYQPYSLSYYQKMKKLGVKSNFIKITEGTYWVASNWVTSFNNSSKAGVIPCAYHFLKASNSSQGANEGEFFAKHLDQGKVSKTVKIMIDAEVNVNNTNSILGFINQVKKHGYSQFTVYSGRYLWVTSKLDQNRLPRPWVAAYPPINNLGINNAAAWQYSDKFNGYSQDISKDLTKDNWFTTDKVSKPSKPSKTNKPVKHQNKPRQGVEIVARDVIKGYYGNGSNRASNIYNKVQQLVNLKASGKYRGQGNHGIALIADDVLFNGHYGNGASRKKNIYNAVQSEVDKLMK